MTLCAGSIREDGFWLLPDNLPPDGPENIYSASGLVCNDSNVNLEGGGRGSDLVLYMLASQ